MGWAPKRYTDLFRPACLRSLTGLEWTAATGELLPRETTGRCSSHGRSWGQTHRELLLMARTQAAVEVEADSGRQVLRGAASSRPRTVVKSLLETPGQGLQRIPDVWRSGDDQNRGDMASARRARCPALLNHWSTPSLELQSNAPVVNSTSGNIVRHAETNFRISLLLQIWSSVSNTNVTKSLVLRSSTKEGGHLGLRFWHSPDGRRSAEALRKVCADRDRRKRWGDRTKVFLDTSMLIAPFTPSFVTTGRVSLFSGTPIHVEHEGFLLLPAPDHRQRENADQVHIRPFRKAIAADCRKSQPFMHTVHEARAAFAHSTLPKQH